MGLTRRSGPLESVAWSIQHSKRLVAHNDRRTRAPCPHRAQTVQSCRRARVAEGLLGPELDKMARVAGALKRRAAGCHCVASRQRLIGLKEPPDQLALIGGLHPGNGTS